MMARVIAPLIRQGVEYDGLVIAPLIRQGVEYDGSRDMHDFIQFVEDARAGRNHIGGVPDGVGSAGFHPDEDDGFRVEL